jgi:hypothetical protein
MFAAADVNDGKQEIALDQTLAARANNPLY